MLESRTMRLYASEPQYIIVTTSWILLLRGLDLQRSRIHIDQTKLFWVLSSGRILMASSADLLHRTSTK